MRMDQVISILESVAAGIDPHSGETIPNNVFHTADVIRAFYAAARMLRQATPPSETNGMSLEEKSVRTDRPPSAGARWTSEEDALVCAAFDGGMAVHDIATQHGRTRGAITSRLVKLGRIDPNTVNVRNRVRLAS